MEELIFYYWTGRSLSHIIALAELNNLQINVEKAVTTYRRDMINCEKYLESYCTFRYEYHQKLLRRHLRMSRPLRLNAYSTSLRQACRHLLLDYHFMTSHRSHFYPLHLLLQATRIASYCSLCFCARICNIYSECT